MVARIAIPLLVLLGLTVTVGWPAWSLGVAAWKSDRSVVPSGPGGLSDPATAIGPSPGAGEWDEMIDRALDRLARPLRLLGESVLLVGLTLVWVMPIGILGAVLLFRTNLPGRHILIGLAVVGLFIPLPLLASSWLGAFGNMGRLQALGLFDEPLLVGRLGASVVHALAGLPWVILIVGFSLRLVERELEEATLLERSAPDVLRTVTMRRSLSAIVAAALTVAVLTAGEMTITDLLRIRTYAEEAYLQYQLGNGPGSAAHVAIPPLMILGPLIALTARLLLRVDPKRLAESRRNSVPFRLGVWTIPIGGLTWMSALLVLGVPVVSLLWRAGRVGGSASEGFAPSWSWTGLAGTLGSASVDLAWPIDRAPLPWTLLLAALGATATLALAWPLAWLARKAGPWRWVTLTVVALTLATPGPIIGMAIKLAYQPGPAPGPEDGLIAHALDWLVLNVSDGPTIMILAYVVRTLPYALLVLWPSMQSIPQAWLDTTALEGHRPWGQAWWIARPSTRLTTRLAWGTSFVLALGELPASNLVRPPGIPTLAGRTWSLLHTGVESYLAGVTLVLIATTIAVGAGVILTTHVSVIQKNG